MNIEVVDASFAAAWLLPDEQSEEAESLLEKVLTEQTQLAVPDLWAYEMLNLLITAHRRHRIDGANLEWGMELLQQIPRTPYDHRSFLSQRRIFRIASRFALSAYDAAYLELADRLQTTLWTFDEALASAADSLGLP